MNAVVERRDSNVAVAHQADPLLLMIERALCNPDIQVDKLNALLDMRIKWDAEQERKAKEEKKELAEQAFVAAEVEFKKLVPKILKDKHVEFSTSKGVTSYDHATIGAVCDAVIPALAAAGLAHSWVPRQENGRIFVTCTLSHPLGHRKSVELNSPPEDSGTKNAIQSISSAITYLERYTLLLVCGVATGGMPDDDGRATGAPAEEVITERQVADLDALITEVGANKEHFLKFSKLEKLEDMPAKNYDFACKALRERGRA